jgi:hypothetical protein
MRPPAVVNDRRPYRAIEIVTDRYADGQLLRDGELTRRTCRGCETLAGLGRRATLTGRFVHTPSRL